MLNCRSGKRCGSASARWWWWSWVGGVGWGGIRGPAPARRSPKGLRRRWQRARRGSGRVARKGPSSPEPRPPRRGRGWWSWWLVGWVGGWVGGGGRIKRRRRRRSQGALSSCGTRAFQRRDRRRARPARWPRWPGGGEARKRASHGFQRWLPGAGRATPVRRGLPPRGGKLELRRSRCCNRRGGC